jgi:tetratricopeptide (TPR) repeat protein
VGATVLPLRLSLFHDLPQDGVGTLLGLLGLAALAALVAAARPRRGQGGAAAGSPRGAALWGALAWLLALLPVLSPARLTVLRADRFLMLPTLGLLLGAAPVLGAALARRAGAWVGGAAVVVLAALTVLDAASFRSEESLARAAYRARADSPEANYRMGYFALERGRAGEALWFLARAYSPGRPPRLQARGEYLKGKAHQALGEKDLARAAYARALRLWPKYGEAAQALRALQAATPPGTPAGAGQAPGPPGAPRP